MKCTLLRLGMLAISVSTLDQTVSFLVQSDPMYCLASTMPHLICCEAMLLLALALHILQVRLQ